MAINETIDSLSLDEMIVHCQEAASKAKSKTGCKICSAEHKQIAEWLSELKILREKINELKRITKKCRVRYN